MVCAGTAQDGPDVIGDADLSELNDAIASYNEEQYRLVLEDIRRNREKYGIV